MSSVVFAVSDEQGHDVLDASVSARDRVWQEQVSGRALALDPGTYVFTFSAPGYQSAERTVSIRESEKNRIVRVELKAAAVLADATVSPPPTAAPHPVPIASYVLGGVAVVGAGAFAYFGLSGNARYDDYVDCRVDCESLRRAGKRDYVVADIAAGVAAASLVSAVIVFFVARPRETDQVTWQLTPVVDAQRAALEWRGKF